MRKILLSVLSISLIVFVARAQNDTIIGWYFSSDTASNTNAEIGLQGNLGYDLRAEDTSYTQRTVQLKNGINGTGDYAAQAEGWDNGAYSKNWSIKFKADGYSDLNLTAVISSGGTRPGPKYWKVQARLSGGNWIDISDTITVANDWTTGQMDALPLPASFNQPGSTSIYIRWISITNENSAGTGNVASDGTIKIDNIAVVATNTSGKEEVIFDSNLKVYPNPVQNVLFVEAGKSIDRIEVLNITGQLLQNVNPQGITTNIDMSGLNNGIYFIRIKYTEADIYHTEKIIVQ